MTPPGGGRPRHQERSPFDRELPGRGRGVAPGIMATLLRAGYRGWWELEIFSDDEAWDVLEEIPNDSAAALILLEHHWAVPLRDAIARAGGFRVSDGFISPLDLVGIGLMSAEEAQALHAAETAGSVG